MSTQRSIVAKLGLIGLAVGLGLLLVACENDAPIVYSGASMGNVPAHEVGTSIVNVVAASGATLEFQTQNGQTVNGVAPQSAQIPHLVLHRNGALTAAHERSLAVKVPGIEVPRGGLTVTLAIETQHGDPDLDDGAGFRIPVWRESVWIPNSGTASGGNIVEFVVEFQSTVASGPDVIPTPTGYFRYRITLTGGAVPRTLAEADYAFLMENQMVVGLPQVQEMADGAAPDELVAYYCDMFPYQNRTAEEATRLRRAEVPDYVERVLVPQVVEAFRVQTDVWGFPWAEAWTSYNGGEDAERLSLILGDGQTWFHGWSPTGGHAGIGLDVRDNLGGATYATLTDRLMAVFQHELFHNHQRNLAQHYGGHADVAGKDSAWDFFSEGTAVLASSVGEARAELTGVGTYLLHANKFVGGHGLMGNLNTGYTETDANTTAIYWRFLYEQCGGTLVVREALRVLYRGEIADIRTSTDVVGHLPAIMDRALAGAACPFTTYRESLNALARALYVLHIEGGRCTSPGQPGLCGFYDPNHLYNGPTTSRITYTGTPLIYDAAKQPRPAGIPSSFGMDFIEIDLDPATDGQPLTMAVYGAPGASATFDVQVWELAMDGKRVIAAKEPVRLTPNTNGHLVTMIPAIDRQTTQRLAVIITRVDARETVDPVGAYTLEVRTAGVP